MSKIITIIKKNKRLSIIIFIGLFIIGSFLPESSTNSNKSKGTVTKENKEKNELSQCNGDICSWCNNQFSGCGYDCAFHNCTKNNKVQGFYCSKKCGIESRSQFK